MAQTLHGAVERIWHMLDSQGQIRALAIRYKSFKLVELFHLCSVVVLDGICRLLPDTLSVPLPAAVEQDT